MEIIYPSVEDITNASKRAVQLPRITKAEQHKLLVNKGSIQKIIDKARDSDTDIKKKAAMFLKEINQNHFFTSANKMTSFIVAADFYAGKLGQSAAGLKK